VPEAGARPWRSGAGATARRDAVLRLAAVVRRLRGRGRPACCSADYLALTISRALTGTAGNWILFTAIAQGGVLSLAILLGKLRGRLPWSLLVGYACLLAAAGHHALGTALAGNRLDVYEEQKVLAGAFLLGPALCAEQPSARAMAARVALAAADAAPLLSCARSRRRPTRTSSRSPTSTRCRSGSASW
jgi:hypothetical protein